MILADTGTWMIGASLVIVGVALASVSVWMWVTTRPDDPLLAPLEVIGDRRFAQGTVSDRAALLKKARTTVLS
jgi:hypothetical protein